MDLLIVSIIALISMGAQFKLFTKLYICSNYSDARNVLGWVNKKFGIFLGGNDERNGCFFKTEKFSNVTAKINPAVDCELFLR